MKGYAKIASLMGKYPEVAMVRQFGALNVQNILYLQAELVTLEHDFRKLEAANDIQQEGHFSLDYTIPQLIAQMRLCFNIIKCSLSLSHEIAISKICKIGWNVLRWGTFT